MLWRKLQLAELLTHFWLLMFSLRIYSKLADGTTTVVSALMPAVAETTRWVQCLPCLVTNPNLEKCGRIRDDCL